jgi:hypothetical protein
MQTLTPTFSRTVLHGNLRNKRGISSEFKNRGKDPLARIGRHNLAPTLPIRAFGDVVIKARPPKEKHQEAFKALIKANNLITKFTIPPRSPNGNIFAQMVMRSVRTHLDVMHELRSYYKSHGFEGYSENDMEFELLE